MKKKYSWELNDFVVDQIPRKIRIAMRQTGWNVWGIYELCKEGIALDKRGKLTSVINSDRESRCACADHQGGPCSFCMEEKFNL